MEEVVDHLQVAFDEAGLPDRLGTLEEEELDNLPFGVIGFDEEGRTRLYNALESRMAGLSPDRVLGRLVFTEVAPCMGNALVAGRFADAARAGTPLDTTIDYVLTLRMRPVRVRLRLVATPDAPLRYLLVDRRP